MRLASLITLLVLSVPAESAGPVAVDAQGAPIGYYVGPAGNYDENWVRLVSSRGYSFAVDQLTGALSGIGYHTGTHFQGSWRGPLFESASCEGQEFLKYSPGFSSQPLIGGFVFSFRGRALYVPKTMVSQERTFLSERDQDGICIPANFQNGRALPMLDNIESETGVKSTPYAAPVTLAIRSTLQTTFEDSFESA